MNNKKITIHTYMNNGKSDNLNNIINDLDSQFVKYYGTLELKNVLIEFVGSSKTPEELKKELNSGKYDEIIIGLCTDIGFISNIQKAKEITKQFLKENK